jgi:hypothetical protein
MQDLHSPGEASSPYREIDRFPKYENFFIFGAPLGSRYEKTRERKKYMVKLERS